MLTKQAVPFPPSQKSGYDLNWSSTYPDSQAPIKITTYFKKLGIKLIYTYWFAWIIYIDTKLKIIFPLKLMETSYLTFFSVNGVVSEAKVVK